ncbi:hypothetical protein F5Y08DRAFT_324112 [Xylaria arbuscula]|nr:hypothetical protein F5Y08DRAFT_324112 [Xylaria arbuscula]
MADPGTVFAIVTIALGAARGLYKFIESAADAPEQLKSVQNELQAVINVLADLRNLETELDEKGSDLPDTTKQAAQNCESACKIFERSLNEWTKTVDDGRLGTRSRLKLWRNKSKIEIFMKNMRTCKATLSVSLGVFNSAKLCRQTTDINKVKDILLHLAEEIEKEKEEEKASRTKD